LAVLFGAAVTFARHCLPKIANPEMRLSGTYVVPDKGFVVEALAHYGVISLRLPMTPSSSEVERGLALAAAGMHTCLSFSMFTPSPPSHESNFLR
jgi:hypothetical protein